MTREEEERFGTYVRELLQEDPPAVPREEMWERIRAARRPRRRVQPWLWRVTALAAMLVIGIGVGRMTVLRSGSAAATAGAEQDQDDASGDDGLPGSYRILAQRHMQRTEALLASLSVDAGATPLSEASGWARDLMTDTRLLLTSPAAEDPALRRLLEDLELVLAQIAAIPSAKAREEAELIQDGINRSDVLLRVRAAAAGPRHAGT